MRRTVISTLAVTMLAAIPAASHAQLGKQMGLLEPNVASDSAMMTLPGMNDALVTALKGARPILSAVALDSILGSKSLGKPQRAELYKRMFVHVDVNRGTDAEFMLIPGMDAKRLAAIKTGRPWKTFEQFDAAMAKAMPAADVPKTEQYLFIPIELNTFTEAIMDSFAGIGVGTRQWKREFNEYRPWTSMEQFDREIGKYVRSRPTELKRLARYVIINK